MIYKGEWVNDTFDGRGWLFNYEYQDAVEDEEFNYKDFCLLGNQWQTYEGEFTQGLWDGIGTLVLTNSQIYTGSFLNGKVDGSGTFTFKDGRKVSGFWKEDKLKFTL